MAQKMGVEVSGLETCLAGGGLGSRQMLGRPVVLASGLLLAWEEAAQDGLRTSNASGAVAVTVNPLFSNRCLEQ